MSTESAEGNKFQVKLWHLLIASAIIAALIAWALPPVDKDRREKKETGMIAQPVRGVVHNGKVELPENAGLEEGTTVLVTALSGEMDDEFWMRVSQSSLDAIWNNEEDDVYADLLKE
jgi:hypothetical protein